MSFLGGVLQVRGSEGASQRTLGEGETGRRDTEGGLSDAGTEPCSRG